MPRKAGDIQRMMLILLEERFALKARRDITRVPEGVSNPPTLAELEARPILVTAIQEQLGLRPEPATKAIDVIVIDSVDRPAAD